MIQNWSERALMSKTHAALTCLIPSNCPWIASQITIDLLLSNMSARSELFYTARNAVPTAILIHFCLYDSEVHPIKNTQEFWLLHSDFHTCWDGIFIIKTRAGNKHIYINLFFSTEHLAKRYVYIPQKYILTAHKKKSMSGQGNVLHKHYFSVRMYGNMLSYIGAYTKMGVLRNYLLSVGLLHERRGFQPLP